jgi:hypothetical protein
MLSGDGITIADLGETLGWLTEQQSECLDH